MGDFGATITLDLAPGPIGLVSRDESGCGRPGAPAGRDRRPPHTRVTPHEVTIGVTRAVLCLRQLAATM